MSNNSRQVVHKMITDGVFKTVKYLGSADKPIYVISSLEVDSLKARGELNS